MHTKIYISIECTRKRVLLFYIFLTSSNMDALFSECTFGSMFMVSMKVRANSNLEKREISESTSHLTSMVRSKHAGV